MQYRAYEKEQKAVRRYSSLTGKRAPLLIIGTSANNDAEGKTSAIAAGMDYFLEKPFSVADFEALLDEIYDDFSEYRDYGDDVTIAGAHIQKSFDPRLSVNTIPEAVSTLTTPSASFIVVNSSSVNANTNAAAIED
jgi:CheY-like chemotaxis protein